MNTTRSGVAINPTLNYVYDNIYRLTQATRPLPALPNETFTYDLLGNRLRRDGQAADSVIGAGNRLLEDAEFTYTYDNNGNLIQKTQKSNGSVTRYVYDAEDQMVRIDFPGGTNAQYRYDGLGRRIEKNVNGTLTRYVYDGEDILFEFNGTNRLTARYTHWEGIDEPLIMERDLNANGSFEAAERFSYHTDGLGSIIDLADSTGGITQSYVYDSFGNIVRQNGTLANPYTYTGREFDAESGLFYYRFRYYDARIGRFLQEDPIGFLVGDVNYYIFVNGVRKFFLYITYFNETNQYVYTGNNPIKRIDPLGLWYIDVNVSVIFPWWGGGTAGIMINQKGIWKYAGGAIGIPGPGASLTYSRQNPSTGWNFTVQGGLLYGIQSGYDLQNIPFAEHIDGDTRRNLISLGHGRDGLSIRQPRELNRGGGCQHEPHQLRI